MSHISLPKKTLGIFGLTLVGLIAVLYVATQIIVLGSFADQETIETRQNVERVRSAIDDNLRLLVGTTRDWALWDDTYTYVQGTNQKYFEENLIDYTSMLGNKLNLMMFVDREARIVLVKGFDYHKDVPIQVPESLRSHIYLGSPLLNHAGTDGEVAGLLSLDEGPMLVVAEPILTSQGEGPPAGTLIFGRFLDDGAISDLSASTLLNISLQPINNPQMGADYRNMLARLTEESPVGVEAINLETIAGYRLYEDVYGKPVLMLRIDMPRDIFARGQQTLQYFVVTLIVAGIVFGVVIVVVLEKLVLARLTRLKADVGEIEARSDMAGRVQLSGDDELSSVATSINSMLTALQRSREEQREGEERYRAVVEQTTEAIFLVDARTGQFLEANAASQILLGYDYDDLLRLTLDTIEVDEVDRRTGALATMRTTGTLRLATERQYRRKNGTVVQVEVSDSAITYGGREALCVVARDITDRKKAEAVLRDLAMRDGLTGLYNRREMQRILKEQIERYRNLGKGSALVMVDIDHFKSVNDTYGHQVGDDVLRWISRVAQEMARPEDKVARFGGEEMAVIMPDTDYLGAFELAERLRSAIAAQPFKFMHIVESKAQSVMIPITISAGVASIPDDAETMQGLVQCADNALYEAKHRGRNKVIAYAQMRGDSQLRLVR